MKNFRRFCVEIRMENRRFSNAEKFFTRPLDREVVSQELLRLLTVVRTRSAFC